MKALLVYPKYPETFWSFKHILKFIHKKAAFPPLGLLTIGAMLPKDWSLQLIDVNVKELKDEDILSADIIFISAMIIQKENTEEIIKRCKDNKKVIVAGGPLFSAQPEKFEQVDYLVLDEAEITLPIFLEDLEKGEAKHVYESEKMPDGFKKRPDIGQTPLPKWDLIKLKDYVTVSVQYSRGCPFNCEFCDIVIMNGKLPRIKSIDQMKREFQTLYDLGWRSSVFVVDDNFIGNKAEVKKLLRAIIDWQKEHDYPFKLYTEASINLADDEELLDLMSGANFFKVFLGLETPDDKGLESCSKIQNTKLDMVESVRKIHNHGMQVMGGFIVGFDTDKETIFDNQIKFIQKIGVVTAMVGLLNALPGTRLHKRLESEGRLITETSGGNVDGTINFIPIMDRDELISGYKRILGTIYDRKHYYQRINNFLKDYNPSVKGGSVSSLDVFIFLKTLFRIGIFSNSRFYYWYFLFRTILSKKNKAFPDVIQHIVTESHYRSVVRNAMKAT